MQFLNARNSFKHISCSTCGTFSATHLPYSFAWAAQFTKMRLSTEVVFFSFILTYQQRAAVRIGEARGGDRDRGCGPAATQRVRKGEVRGERRDLI